MANCNVCGKSCNGLDLCDECMAIANIGTYVVCVKCDKIALTIFGPNLNRRTYYSTKCRNCTGEDIRRKPLDVYSTSEEATKVLNKKEKKQNESTNNTTGQ